MFLGSRRRPCPIGRENLEQPAHPTRPGRAASLRRAISVLVLSLLMSVIPSLAAAAPNNSPPFDFSISAAPGSLSIVPGNSDSSTINTSVSLGKAKHVKLEANVSPAGPTVSLSADSVTAGASATLTVGVGAAVAPGSYTVTEASNTHSTTVALTVSAPDFSITAAPSSLSILPGSSGASTISTAVTSGTAGTVSLSASVSPAGPTASLSPGSVTAGGSSTLTVSVGASAAPGIYTITITGTEGSATHGATVTLTIGSAGVGGITNGGFETGSLGGWTSSGTTGIISSGAHSGAFAARVGDAVPTNGDSSIAQTFTVPAGKTELSFWYQVSCPDTLTYDWATATLGDNTAGTTINVLPKTCTPAGTWVNRTASVEAGHSYTLTLTNHDDNYLGDPTFTLYDVTLN